MKSNMIQQLQSVYVPVSNSHNTAKFSQAQTEACYSYINDSVQTLNGLCQQVILDVRKILMTVWDILDMFTRVPSISNENEILDMSETVCSTFRSLASHIDSYDIDPSNVTADMIKSDCDDVVSYHFNKLNYIY